MMNKLVLGAIIAAFATPSIAQDAGLDCNDAANAALPACSDLDLIPDNTTNLVALGAGAAILIPLILGGGGGNDTTTPVTPNTGG